MASKFVHVVHHHVVPCGSELVCICLLGECCAQSLIQHSLKHWALKQQTAARILGQTSQSTLYACRIRCQSWLPQQCHFSSLLIRHSCHFKVDMRAVPSRRPTCVAERLLQAPQAPDTGGYQRPKSFHNLNNCRLTQESLASNKMNPERSKTSAQTTILKGALRPYLLPLLRSAVLPQCCKPLEKLSKTLLISAVPVVQSR